MKKIISVSINKELHEKAKRLMNISEVAEDAIKEKLGEKIIQPNETFTCQFCGKEGYKETSDMVKSATKTEEPIEYPNALTWLWPDEKWICNSCLRRKSKDLPVSQ